MEFCRFRRLSRGIGNPNDPGNQGRVHALADNISFTLPNRFSIHEELYGHTTSFFI